jgi:amino acid transporter
MFDKGWWSQTIAVIIITCVQAWVNHRGIRMTTLLTDFAGYLIFGLTVILILALLAWAPAAIDLGRLFTFSDFTGDAGGGVWPTPANDRWLGAIFPAAIAALILGLLQGVYTIIGFDASGHTSEETRNAAREVPKGMIQSVFWSAIFGYIMVATFVLAMPSVEEGAAQGWLAFFMMERWERGDHQGPANIGIVVSNFCAWRAPSCSRMLYIPRVMAGAGSPAICKVSKQYRTANAIRGGGSIRDRDPVCGRVLCSGDRLCGVLYVLHDADAAGFLNEGTKWTRRPFNRAWSKPVALLFIGCVPWRPAAQ